MRGIEFEVVWFDQDVIQYQVTCSNGPFRGATKMNLAHDDLQKTAEALSAFPSNVTDSRDVQLGESLSVKTALESGFKRLHYQLDPNLTET